MEVHFDKTKTSLIEHQEGHFLPQNEKTCDDIVAAIQKMLEL